MDPYTQAEQGLEELHQDIAFQRRFWRVERVAWAGFALVLALALAGLTGGGGPLAHATAKTAYGSIAYPRVARWLTDDVIVVRLDAAPRERVTVELDRRFAEAFEIVSMQPEPATSAATPHGMRYAFAVDGAGEVVLHVRPLRPAAMPDGLIRVDGEATPVRPLVLP